MSNRPILFEGKKGFFAIRSEEIIEMCISRKVDKKEYPTMVIVQRIRHSGFRKKDVEIGVKGDILENFARWEKAKIT